MPKRGQHPLDKVLCAPSTRGTMLYFNKARTRVVESRIFSNNGRHTFQAHGASLNAKGYTIAQELLDTSECGTHLEMTKLAVKWITTGSGGML